MWFSYPKEENWVPVPIKHVREIQQINKSGELVPDLGESKVIDANAVKAFDYENVVGQDSLTRLDERSANRNKKNNNNRNKPRPAPEAGQKPISQVTKVVTQNVPVKTVQPNNLENTTDETAREINPNRRHHRRNRPNRNPNNQNNSDQPNNPKAE